MINKSSDNLLLEEKYKLVADSIRAFPLQVKQVWDDISSSHIPDDYKNVDNIVFCGMGGSALGARVADSYAFDRLKVPMKIYNDYKIPGYVNNRSLVIVSSYSGNTEEPIEFLYGALKKGAKIIGIATGGTLADLLVKEKAIPYVFDPIYNPSKQPRLGIGYSVGAILAILAKLGFINLTNDEVENALLTMNNLATEYNENAPGDKNLALSYAQKLKGRIPILVASEHLVGTSHAIKNMFNESAKTFSFLFEIPELNHHLLEGLKYPAKLREIFTFFFFDSNLYHEKVLKRYKVTADVVEKNGVNFLSYRAISTDRLSQVFELLTLGSFIVYFLAKMYKIDPLEIPWVDFFKKELAQK